MVRGLFPHAEQETVLDVLGRSVVFLSPATIDNGLNEIQWPGTAWTLANLYLASYGGELLDVPRKLVATGQCLIVFIVAAMP